MANRETDKGKLSLYQKAKKQCFKTTYIHSCLYRKQDENNSISADSLIFGESFLKTLNKRLDGVRITGIFSLTNSIFLS